MLVETRKLHLIEELLKIDDTILLSELDTIIKRAGKGKKNRPVSAQEFAGKWSKEDAALIEKAIEDGCEQINEDDWR